jgi:hypothetical protein
MHISKAARIIPMINQFLFLGAGGWFIFFPRPIHKNCCFLDCNSTQDYTNKLPGKVGYGSSKNAIIHQGFTMPENYQEKFPPLYPGSLPREIQTRASAGGSSSRSACAGFNPALILLLNF